MSNGHAYLSPSASSRWLTCTASPGLIDQFKGRIDNTSSVYAEEGTRAHELAEDCLIMDMNAIDFKDEKGVDDDMVEHVQGYLDFVRSEADGEEILTESKLPLYYNPKQNGTADSTFYKPEIKKLTTVDLKYGMGVSVQAVLNSQLAIYMRSLIKKRGWTKNEVEIVEMVIYQPRVFGEQAVRTWEVGYDEFMEFTDNIGDKAKKIESDPQSPDLVFKASESACRWCPVSTYCKVHAQFLLGGTPLELDNIIGEDFRLPDVDTLEISELALLESRSKDLIKWINSAVPHLTHLTQNEDELGIKTGYKMVLSKGGHRAWSDPVAAEKILAKKLKKNERTTMKIISPAQAEKKLKNASTTDKYMAEVESQIFKPSGNPVLAPLSDKREAIGTVVADEEFTNLDEQE